MSNKDDKNNKNNLKISINSYKGIDKISESESTNSNSTISKIRKLKQNNDKRHLKKQNIKKSSKKIINNNRKSKNSDKPEEVNEIKKENKNLVKSTMIYENEKEIINKNKFSSKEYNLNKTKKIENKEEKKKEKLDEERERARKIIKDRREREERIKRENEEKERREKEEKERLEKKEKEERERRKREEKERREREEREEKERKEKERREREEKEEKERKEKEKKEREEKEEKERKEKEREEKEKKEKEKKEIEEKEEKERKNKEKKEKDDEEKSTSMKSTNISSSLNSNYYNSEVYKIITSKIGLRNLGNTCFMNTCLQNLIHSEYFIQTLFQKKYLISSKTPISEQFLELCLKFTSNESSVSPNNFKIEFGEKHRMFSGYRQQDTQEFCRILLEDMNRELNEVKNPAPYKELSTLNKTKEVCNKEFDELFRKRENSLIMDVFYAQIINIFICKCKFETYSFQKILDLPLLFKGSSSCDIETLLDYYFEEDDIQFETKCEKCGGKELHKKQMKITQPPNILILSLQRRNEYGGKNNSRVSFPDKLDLGKYIDNECGNKNDAKYTLYGIGNHSGSLDFGHYYAYIKIDDNKWNEYNDSSVTSHIFSNSNSSTAYVLFYKKNK